jgi:GTPase
MHSDGNHAKGESALAMIETKPVTEKAILVEAYLDRRQRNSELLDELALLAETAGVEVVGRYEQVRDRPDPAFYIGSGKAEELGQEAVRLGAHVAIFDVELSPSQVRNLEKVINVKVIDRTELILDIFARHARTNAAKLQVELAQLEYTYPRLIHMWQHLEKIRGGIGTRGPGETQIETDRRIVRKRIGILKERIADVASRRGREVEARTEEANITLVGYTNAGKSSLMNALTDAGVEVKNALFVTLDTRTRRWHLAEERNVLLSDTVGFIRSLPHGLVASFYATLEEVRQADLLLHVVDVASPHAREQADTVNSVLRDLGCESKPRLLLLNKADLLQDESMLPLFRHEDENSLLVSAKTGQGLDVLREKVIEHLDRFTTRVTVTMGPENGKLQAFLERSARVEGKRFTEVAAEYAIVVKPGQLDQIRRLGGKIAGNSVAAPE